MIDRWQMKKVCTPSQWHLFEGLARARHLPPIAPGQQKAEALVYRRAAVAVHLKSLARQLALLSLVMFVAGAKAD
jgi:hypothetical protein